MVKVKVKTLNGEKLKFERIGINNGNFYGVKKAKGEMLRTPLSEEMIVSIKEKDETSSTIVTVFASAISGVVISYNFV